MPYIITATLTYSSQANRDAARTRIDSAIAGLPLSALATALAAGINNPTTTTITISMRDGLDATTASDAANAIYNASTQTNRHISGYLSINYVP